MKRTILILALVAGLGLTNQIQACSPYTTALDSLAKKAVSSDPKVASPAMAELRAKGPAGLEALFQTHTDAFVANEKGYSEGTPTSSNAWQRLRLALDSVSGQRDCYASHLYWYTDFEKAKASAKVSGKPILSLRLLGNLDEEYSCANSRFFRTTLYANSDVSEYLRNHFILHWKSVRPVPRMTIDFGDGRKIERTITGNSIHYILDSEGQPIDALPGLYGPKAFLKGLSRAEQTALKYATLATSEREQFLQQYHSERYTALNSELNGYLMKMGDAQPVAVNNPTLIASLAPPSALAAGRAAFSKGRVEVPALKSIQRKTTALGQPESAGIEDVMWSKIASLHAEDSKLDYNSQTLLRKKNLSARAASDLSTSKRQQERPLLKAFENLERSIAEDTVRNEYSLHSQIHKWFASNSAPRDLDKLNVKVYDELFLTPDSDPWLGLAPADTLSGLDQDGLVQVTPAR